MDIDHTEAVNAKSSRKRGIKLTDEGFTLLCKTLYSPADAAEITARPTLAVLSERMGVSVATTKRVLNQAGVDRATLVHFFRQLGLKWDDDFIQVEFDSPSPEASHAEADISVAVAQPLATRSSKWPLNVFSLVAMITLLLVVAWSWRPTANPSRTVAKSTSSDWAVEYDRLLSESSNSYYKGDYPVARAKLGAALQIAVAYESLKDFSGAYQLKGQLCELEDLQKAKAAYQRVVDIRQDYGLPAWAPIHESLGLVEVRLRDFSNASLNLQICLEASRKMNDPVAVALAYRNLGSLNLARNNLDIADGWFNQCLEILRRFDKPEIVADVQGQKALVLLKRGRAEAALAELTKCLEYWSSKGQIRWVASCQMRVAMAHEALHKFAQAKSHLQESIKNFKGAGDEVQTKTATDHLERIEAKIARTPSES